MGSNKAAKQRLIELYGAECFIDKLKLRKFDKSVHYKSKGQKKRMEMLTYHHIKMKKDGGRATVENGALLSAKNHQWFHQQPQKDQDRMNQAFQDYKRDVDNGYIKCDIEFVDEIEEPYDLEIAEISVVDETIAFRKLSKEHKKQEFEKQLRKEKKEMQRLRKQYEDR